MAKVSILRRDIQSSLGEGNRESKGRGEETMERRRGGRLHTHLFCEDLISDVS